MVLLFRNAFTKSLLKIIWRSKITFVYLQSKYENKIMKVIDGMVYCNEIDKWVTVEEYIKEYKL